MVKLSEEVKEETRDEFGRIPWDPTPDCLAQLASPTLPLFAAGKPEIIHPRFWAGISTFPLSLTRCLLPFSHIQHSFFNDSQISVLLKI
jgi:hypothetical protein